MKQTVHPIGFRLGINQVWYSRWYAKKDFVLFLHEDIRLRTYLKQKLYHAGIARIEIERAAQQVKINIYAARPGMIIGKRSGGKAIKMDTLRNEVQKFSKSTVFLNVLEVKRPEANATLIAENIVSQLKQRVAFRRAMKKCIKAAFNQGVKGIKMQVSGRLGGSDIARTEWYNEGSVPLHTIRAHIDYGFSEAHTTYGKTGVKVYVYYKDYLK